MTTTPTKAQLAAALAVSGGVKPDANGNVPVAGLLVPAPLVPRIVAAVRGLYPTLADGRTDDAAVRAWLKWVVTAILSQWEAQQALAPVTDAVDATRQDYQKRAETARARAVADAASIVEAPPPVVTPPVVVPDTPPADPLPTDPAPA